MEIQDPETFLAMLRELSEHTLIVEGRKDAAALNALQQAPVMQAFKCLQGRSSLQRHLKTLGLIDVIPINGQPLSDFVDRLDEKKSFVILTDFDKEGKRLCAKLLKLLQRRRIKANPRLRRMFMKETGITQIEGLAAGSAAALIEKEKGDSYGETGANFYEIYNKGKHKGEGNC
ncbi:MAG: hypothetical protein FJY76_02090 [Candidatus Aenigmarchaeota archaeon]|nr:hypothetical protein [Candidatus Aenigmarchaeota archaeon]